ncbi:uncharacterized protein [Gossypium hirsutum]|uniref:Uncharacterized protein isoform X2 n=1 Tax=Gossypium hirsutum TaxID=3635 RepID=A0ABM3ADR9_GOSHI|nr:uncharacterized protein LOC107953860 isoform X2 [Gossypium hirsutum]
MALAGSLPNQITPHLSLFFKLSSIIILPHLVESNLYFKKMGILSEMRDVWVQRRAKFFIIPSPAEDQKKLRAQQSSQGFFFFWLIILPHLVESNLYFKKVGILSEMRDVWVQRRAKFFIIPSPAEDQKKLRAQQSSQEGIRAGLKAAAITGIFTAVPTIFLRSFSLVTDCPFDCSS